MKKRSFFDFFENYPLSLFGYEKDENYFKTDRYIDDGISISPFILYAFYGNYPFNRFWYNGFYGF